MELQEAPCEANQFHQTHVALLFDSYARLLKRPLMEVYETADLGRQAFFADFALLSHNTQSDPIFNYANKTALDLFELSWADLISMPSRLSAEAGKQEERDKAMLKVTNNGYIEDYSGVRISKSGKRFLMRGAVVWNVIDRQGQYRGQAACFKEWTWL